MKKLISLILVLCMACALAPAMAEGVTGTWYLIEMNADGVSVNPADMGMTWTLVFNEDGTAVNTMEMMGETQTAEGTWSMDGNTVTITIEGEPKDVEIADGKLMLSTGEQIAVFSQEAPTASARPAAVAAESEDAFLGDWEISGLEMMGMYITRDMFSVAQMEYFTVKLSIAPGKVTLTSKVSAEAEEESQEFDSTFADGKLTVPIDLGITPETAAAMGIDLSALGDGVTTIELSDEGGLIYNMNFMGMLITVFLLPAQAAEAPAA